MASTPSEEINWRIKLLQSALGKRGLDAALIVQRVDLFYFSGTGQEAHLFVPSEGSPRLLVRKNLERAQADSPLEDIKPLLSFSELKREIESSQGKTLRSLGMELDILPFNNYKVYSDLFPQTQFFDVSPLIRELRMIKSPYELELINQAARMNDQMFACAREILREGLTEMEFSGLLEAEYRKRGHQGYVRIRSFNQEIFYGHVMSGSNLAVPSCSVGPTGGPGPNPSLPHGASLKVIERHEPVQVDYVGVMGGYMVDQARTFFIGEPPEEFLRIHSLALKIQQIIVDEGCPGASSEHLYELAVEMASEAGMLDGFLGYPHAVPFVGHGIGLELDELPVLGRKSPHCLTPGMVIALEPKFILPGKGLAGIENSFVVTDQGMKKLTLFDDAIQVIHH